jgi:hypothetical protein
MDVGELYPEDVLVDIWIYTNDKNASKPGNEK